MLAKNELKILLQHLNAAAINRLRKFVISPYHNTDERLAELLEAYVAAAKGAAEPVAQTHYERWFPGRVYHERVWQDLVRKLLRLLQQFLAHDYLYQRPLAQAQLGISARTALGVPDLTLPFLQQQLDSLSTLALPPWEEAYWQQHWYQARYELPQQERKLEDLFAQQQHLQRHFLLLTFRYATDAISRSFTFSEAHLDRERLLLPLAEQEAATDPTLAFYLRVYHLYGRFARGHIDLLELRALRQAYETIFPQLHALDRAFYQVKIVNLYSYASRKGHPQLRAELFAVCRFGVQQRVYWENGKISGTTFANLVTLACAEGEMAWAQQFWDAHADHLHAEQAANVRALTAAQIAFRSGQFAKASQYLGAVERPGRYERLRLHVIQVQSLTELYLQNPVTYTYPLRSRLNSFRQFAASAPFAESMRQSYFAFIKVLRTIVNQRQHGYGPAVIHAAALQVLENAPGVIAGTWLREKIDSLLE